jgi:hypothetical protein
MYLYSYSNHIFTYLYRQSQEWSQSHFFVTHSIFPSTYAHKTSQTISIQIVTKISYQQLELINSLTALRLIRVVTIIPTLRQLLTMALASTTNILNAWLFFFGWISMFAVCAMYWLHVPRAETDSHATVHASTSSHRRSELRALTTMWSNSSSVLTAEYHSTHEHEYALVTYPQATGPHRRAGAGSQAQYQTYEDSLVTLFQIFTGEHWRFVLVDTITMTLDNNAVLRALFVIAFFFLSQTVVLNIFIAVSFFLVLFSPALVLSDCGFPPTNLCPAL